MQRFSQNQFGIVNLTKSFWNGSTEQSYAGRQPGWGVGWGEGVDRLQEGWWGGFLAGIRQQSKGGFAGRSTTHTTSIEVNFLLSSDALFSFCFLWHKPPQPQPLLVLTCVPLTFSLAPQVLIAYLDLNFRERRDRPRINFWPFVTDLYLLCTCRVL